MLRLCCAQPFFHFSARGCLEMLLRGGVSRCCAQSVCGPPGPAMQSLSEFRDVRARIVGIPKMREEQTMRPPRQNRRERMLPNGQIDVGRRRSRKDVWTVVN